MTFVHIQLLLEFGGMIANESIENVESGSTAITKSRLVILGYECERMMWVLKAEAWL
jgi:hypothetical protein